MYNNALCIYHSLQQLGQCICAHTKAYGDNIKHQDTVLLLLLSPELRFCTRLTICSYTAMQGNENACSSGPTVT